MPQENERTIINFCGRFCKFYQLMLVSGTWWADFISRDAWTALHAKKTPDRPVRAYGSTVFKSIKCPQAHTVNLMCVCKARPFRRSSSMITLVRNCNQMTVRPYSWNTARQAAWSGTDNHIRDNHATQEDLPEQTCAKWAMHPSPAGAVAYNCHQVMIHTTLLGLCCFSADTRDETHRTVAIKMAALRNRNASDR